MARKKKVQYVPLETIWETPDEVWEKMEAILEEVVPTGENGSTSHPSSKSLKRDPISDAHGVSVEPVAEGFR